MTVSSSLSSARPDRPLDMHLPTLAILAAVILWGGSF